MKKLISTILAAICIAAFAVGFVACGQKDDANKNDVVNLSVYMPDGAPALSVAKLMKEAKTFENVKPEYNVVPADTIATYVSGQSPKADLAILPVNAASKLLGSGENYKMLGTVTHGNLFLLSSKYDTQITLSDIDALKGKTIGVVNLANVPGLTFKLILKENGIQFGDVANEDVIGLKAIDAPAVGTLSDVDYYVVPEPAASTKASAIKDLNVVGSLQTLYGGDNGYPQAVLVAKTSVIENNAKFIAAFIDEVKANEQYLLSEETTGEMLFDTVKNHLPDGTTPSMNANQLNNKTILKNCAIKFTAAVDCKDEVNAFIAKLIGVNANAAAQVSDEFFYVPAK